MKINLNELSKIKYIYHVYEDPQRVIHCQKYPVIYINQYVVYYKVPGDIELSRRSLNSVYELCDDDWINRCGSDKIFSFFWEVDPDLLSCNKVRSDLYKLNKSISDLNRATANYAKAKDALFKAEYKVMKITEEQGDFTFKSGDIWHNKTKDEYWLIVNHIISDKFLLGRTCYLSKDYKNSLKDSILIGDYIIKFDYIFNQYYKDDQLLKYSTEIYPKGTWEKVHHLSDEQLLKYHTKDMERDAENCSEE